MRSKSNRRRKTRKLRGGMDIIWPWTKVQIGKLDPAPPEKQVVRPNLDPREHEQFWLNAPKNQTKWGKAKQLVRQPQPLVPGLNPQNNKNNITRKNPNKLNSIYSPISLLPVPPPSPPPSPPSPPPPPPSPPPSPPPPPPVPPVRLPWGPSYPRQLYHPTIDPIPNSNTNNNDDNNDINIKPIVPSINSNNENIRKNQNTRRNYTPAPINLGTKKKTGRTAKNWASRLEGMIGPEPNNDFNRRMNEVEAYLSNIKIQGKRPNQHQIKSRNTLKSLAGNIKRAKNRENSNAASNFTRRFNNLAQQFPHAL